MATKLAGLVSVGDKLIHKGLEVKVLEILIETTHGRGFFLLEFDSPDIAKKRFTVVGIDEVEGF